MKRKTRKIDETMPSKLWRTKRPTSNDFGRVSNAGVDASHFSLIVLCFRVVLCFGVVFCFGFFFLSGSSSFGFFLQSSITWCICKCVRHHVYSTLHVQHLVTSTSTQSSLCRRFPTRGALHACDPRCCNSVGDTNVD